MSKSTTEAVPYEDPLVTTPTPLDPTTELPTTTEQQENDDDALIGRWKIFSTPWF